MNIQTGIYQHFKGGTVFVYGTAESSDNNTILVLYQGLQDNVHHARPYTSFNETIEKDGKTIKRFTLIKSISIEIDKQIENITKDLKRF